MIPGTQIIYLDQNKWIDLLLAEHAPLQYPRELEVLRKLEARCEAGELLLPLTGTNIYETYKIGDPQKRAALAMLQARLSGGFVFRGRRARIDGELYDFLEAVYGKQMPPRPPVWFLSDTFFEALADFEDGRTGFQPSPRLIESVRQRPATALFHYLTTAPDDERLSAVKRWSEGSAALASQVEERRTKHKGEALAMRLRIYNALMMISELPLLGMLAEKYGVDWSSTAAIGDKVGRRIVEEMPIYQTERELVVRLEAQERPIHENDFRDVQAYCAAIVYADVIVGENQLINLARQGGLGKKYNTRLETDILTLE
jgi:hypothetical protein